jgi:hypothetical protein
MLKYGVLKSKREYDTIEKEHTFENKKGRIKDFNYGEIAIIKCNNQKMEVLNGKE